MQKQYLSIGLSTAILLFTLAIQINTLMAQEQTSKPLACKLTEQERADRMQKLKKEIFSKVQVIEERESGYVYIFDQPESFSETLVNFINFERECCPFFTFSLTFEPNEGPIRLSIYGSGEIKSLLKQAITERNMENLIINR